MTSRDVPVTSWDVTGASVQVMGKFVLANTARRLLSALTSLSQGDEPKGERLMTVLAEEVDQVSPDQIRHFDREAFDLVARYHLAGWRSHLTSNGHVFLKSPDGVETASVTRESLHGRSGRNAAAPLKRWHRRQEQQRAEREAAERKRPGSAFGIANMTTAKADDPLASVPPRVAKAIRDSADVIGYIGANYKRFSEDNISEALYIGVEHDANRPAWEMWVVVDTEKNVLVAHGPGYTRAEALKMLRSEGKLPPATLEEIMAAAEGNTICPECGHEAASVGGLNLHIKRAHVGYVCPECGFDAGASGRKLAAHREHEHGVTPAARIKKAGIQARAAERDKKEKAKLAGTICTGCGEAFTTKQGLANHQRTAHARDVTGDLLALVAGQPNRTITVNHAASVMGIGAGAAGTAMSRLAKKGQLVRTERGVYRLPDGVDIKDVTGTSLAVTPAKDTEDVTVTSPVVTAAAPPAIGLDAVEDPATVVAKIQAAIAPGLVAQLHEVTKERDLLIEERDRYKAQVTELQTALGMVRETVALLGDG